MRPRAAALAALAAVALVLAVFAWPRVDSGDDDVADVFVGVGLEDETTSLRARPVSVVCLGDTHGRHLEVRVPDADVLVFTGDAVDPHDATSVREQLRKFNGWLRSLPHKYKVFVAGNHDAERDVALADLRGIITEAVYLEDETLEIRVAGADEPVRIYGSPWQPQWDGFETFRPAGPALAKTFARIADQVPDILATHSPPRGFFDLDPDGVPIGSKDLLVATERTSPALHCFGHVHAGRTADMMTSQKRRAHPITFVNGAICNDDLKAVWDPVRVLL